MDCRESTDGCCDEIPTDGYHGEVHIDGCLRVDVATNGYQYSMDTSTDGCLFLYVGDIEILNGEIVASTHSFDHRDLATEEEDLGLTYTSPLEFHEVDSTYGEEEVHSHYPSYLVGTLQLGEKNIKKYLHILHHTCALVSYLCWRVTSLEY